MRVSAAPGLGAFLCRENYKNPPERGRRSGQDLSSELVGAVLAPTLPGQGANLVALPVDAADQRQRLLLLALQTGSPPPQLRCMYCLTPLTHVIPTHLLHRS